MKRKILLFLCMVLLCAFPCLTMVACDSSSTPINAVTDITILTENETSDTLQVTYYDGTTQSFSIEKGKTDTDGKVCEDGQNGTDGKDGADGKDGIDGQNGKDGANGKDGIDGQNGKDGADGKDGIDGQNGKDVYELYCEKFGYTGTLEEWLSAVTNGTLGTATQRTITFHCNEGSLPEDSEDTVTVTDGKTTILPTPVLDGYLFLGWYTGNHANAGKFTDTTPVCADTNLYAHWQLSKVMVTFVNYDDTILSEQEVGYGESAVAPKDPPTKEGEYFDHWDKDFTCVTNHLTVKPVFALTTYTVSFDSNGGTEVGDLETDYGTCVSKPANPTLTGYVFLGWYVEGDLYDFTTPLNFDTTLTAHWTDSITIRTYEQLVAISEIPDGNYTLESDINCDGNEWVPIPTFSGHLDGKGHKIYNVTLSNPQEKVSFFQTNDGTIENIELIIAVSINATTANCYIAPLCNSNNGTINNIELTLSLSVNDSASNSYIAPLCNINNGTVSHCTTTGTSSITVSGSVTALYYSNLVSVNHGTITNCITNFDNDLNIVEDSKNTTLNCYFGSLASQNSATGTISSGTVNCTFDVCNNKSRASSVVEGTKYKYGNYYYGGVVGTNQGSIFDCNAFIEYSEKCNIYAYAYGYRNYGAYVTSCCYIYMGGIAGQNQSSGTIETSNVQSDINFIYDYYYWLRIGDFGEKCTTCSSVLSLKMGGICGINDGSASIIQCQANTDINIETDYKSTDHRAVANEELGGIVGYNATSTNSITKCISSGTISGHNNAHEGGLAGSNYGSIRQCYSDTDITAKNISDWAKGGLVGRNYGGALVYNCICNANVIQNGTDGNNGYIVGNNEGSVTNCYYDPDVDSGEQELNSDGGTSAVETDLLTENIIYDTLWWSDTIWAIEEGYAPYLIALAEKCEHTFDTESEKSNVCTKCGYVEPKEEE